jgi:SMODS-associating 2TM, beta-strand rich effector domain
MHYYSIDTNPRERVLYTLAAVAVGLLATLTRFRGAFWYPYLAPSGPVIYALLVACFDRWLWRILPVRRALRIPDLNGVWEGEFHREDRDDPHEVKVTITQSLSRIKITFRGRSSSSTSIAADLSISDEQNVLLRWQYDSKPLIATEQATDKYGEGAARASLEIDHGEYRLAGLNFTSKKRLGSFVVHRIGKHSRSIL